MLRKTLLTLTALSLLVPLFSFVDVRPAQAQGGPTVLIANLILQGSDKSKFPDLDVYGPTTSVVVSGNANERDALFWEKADTATAFGGPIVLGAARGTPDYATVSLAYDTDGSLNYVWADIPGRSLFYRSRPSIGSAFGPAVLVAESSFPSEAKVVTTRLGGVKTIFIFWREASGELRYVLSQNEGLPGSWTAPGFVVSRGAFLEFSAFAGPNGQVVVGYTLPGGSDGNLKAWGAFWNGTGFVQALVSPPANGGFAEPSFALKPDGTWAAAYRGIEQNANFGLYYTEQQPDGSWPILLRDRGDTNAESLVIDELGNTHIFFTGVPAATGRMNLYYALRRSGAANFDRVLEVPMASDFISAANAAVNIRGQVLAHVATEAFNGGVARYKYALLGLAIPTVGVGGVSLEGGLAISRNTNVTASFSDVVGVPTRVRYRWGAPPTPDDPALPFDPANPNVSIPAPEGGAVCTEQTLFAQLEADNLPPSAVVQDTIVLDRALQATLEVTSGAVGYDPNFTNQRSVQIAIDSANDCAGLNRVVITGAVEGSPITREIGANPNYVTDVTLSAGAGPKTFQIELFDNLGNTAPVLTRTLTYDPVAPVQTTAGALEVTALENTTILYAFELLNAAATDTGSGLYGLLVTAQVTPTSGGAPTTAQVVVPFSAMSSVVQANGRVSLSAVYSVLSGLPANLRVPGTYRITAQFVDRAGNVAAATAFTETLTINQIVRPRTYLPLTRR